MKISIVKFDDLLLYKGDIKGRVAVNISFLERPSPVQIPHKNPKLKKLQDAIDDVTVITVAALLTTGEVVEWAYENIIARESEMDRNTEASRRERITRGSSMIAWYEVIKRWLQDEGLQTIDGRITKEDVEMLSGRFDAKMFEGTRKLIAAERRLAVEAEKAAAVSNTIEVQTDGSDAAQGIESRASEAEKAEHSET